MHVQLTVFLCSFVTLSIDHVIKQKLLFCAYLCRSSTDALHEFGANIDWEFIDGAQLSHDFILKFISITNFNLSMITFWSFTRCFIIYFHVSANGLSIRIVIIQVENVKVFILYRTIEEDARITPSLEYLDLQILIYSIHLVPDRYIVYYQPDIMFKVYNAPV